MRSDLRPWISATILVAGGGAILTALAFEHLLGYVPCALCLDQRWPYYIGLPLAALAGAAVLLKAPRWIIVVAFAAVAALFAYGAGLGVWHAGIEWKFWPGPDCMAGGGLPDSGQDLLESLSESRLVPCDEAAWRLLGISMAGYNALISAGIAALAVIGAAWRRSQGSSSLSQ